MAKLQISGQVLYNNLTVAPNARVEIWERDLGPGGVNDKILTRTTNDQGRFSGLSSEWADREGTVFGVPVPDVLNLEFRVTVDGKTHSGPFVMGQGTSIAIVLPWGPPKSVSKSKRDLVQVIYLSDQYTGGERSLYQFIEASSEGVVAVDVMFNTHGATNKVVFQDGAKTMTTVKDSLNGLSAGTRAKFRAVLSTACFGATHLSMWSNIGFSAACGAAGIYADSALSFAPLVAKWASEATFAETVQLANAAGQSSDGLSKAYYEATGRSDKAEQVNSTRTIGGNGQVRLYSLP